MEPGASGLPDQVERWTHLTALRERSWATAGKRSGMTRREDHAQAGLGLEELRPELQQGLFFALEGAAADEEFGAGRELFAKSGGDGSGGNGADVVFQIAAKQNAIRRRTNCLEAVDVLGTLREDERERREDAAPEKAETAVARVGAVGDAGVDDRDRNAGGAALVEEVGPEFGFGQDEEVGAEQAQVAADDDGEVEGEVEHVLRTKAFAGEALAGAGGGREQDADFCGAEILNQLADGEHFADGDGVDPDDGSFGGRTFALGLWRRARLRGRRLGRPAARGWGRAVRTRAGTAPRRSARPSRYLPLVTMRKSQ